MATTNRPTPRTPTPAPPRAPAAKPAAGRAKRTPTHTTQGILIAQLAKRMECPQTEARAWYDAVRLEVQAAVIKDRKFYWKDFGNFVVKIRSARTGRNPRTGAELRIAARNVLLFKAAPVLAKAL